MVAAWHGGLRDAGRGDDGGGVDRVGDRGRGAGVARHFLQAVGQVDGLAEGGEGEGFGDADFADEDGAAGQANAIAELGAGFLEEERGEAGGGGGDGGQGGEGGAFAFDPAVNRSVAVSTAAITEALDKVYHDTSLVQELTGG